MWKRHCGRRILSPVVSPIVKAAFPKPLRKLLSTALQPTTFLPTKPILPALPVLPAPPKVNFKEEVVLGVFMGRQNGGGHAAKVTSLERFGNDLYVTVRYTRPAPGTPVTLMLTSPYHFVAIDTQGAKGNVYVNGALVGRLSRLFPRPPLFPRPIKPVKPLPIPVPVKPAPKPFPWPTPIKTPVKPQPRPLPFPIKAPVKPQPWPTPIKTPQPRPLPFKTL
jgi:hypothetical protein